MKQVRVVKIEIIQMAGGGKALILPVWDTP
jgi:hypothetical protein